MPRHCSVPNCKSNYATTLKYEKAQSTFSFPKNDHLRTQWVRSINREDFRVTSSSVVCKKHFDATDIIESESFIDKNGTVLQRNLVYPKLKENAIPRIFENQPSYLSNPKPPTRKNPETRRAEISLREENNIKELENKDLIVDFKELLQSVSERVELKNWQIKVVEERICFYLLNIDNQFSDECIKVISNINITKELLVSVYVKDIQLSPHDLKCILPFDCKLSRWSQLENLLSRYSFFFESPIDNNFKITKICSEIDRVIENTDVDKMKGVLAFVKNQLLLLTASRAKYSLPTIIFALTIYNQSTSCYNIIQQYLNLPTKRYLQMITSSFHVSPDDQLENNYLSYLASNLNDREKIVNLLVDEIYVNPGVHYHSKQITGFAANNDKQLAKTILTLMISSAFAHFKEVVRLVPVCNIAGNELKDIVLESIQYIQDCGFKVLCVITDNNRLNQNMFGQLSPNFSISNPKFNNENIYLLYDFVHIFKNIRNNWLNKKDPEKTFIFPDFNNHSVLRKAFFKDLQTLYQIEINFLTKRAYKLNHKSIYPNNFERQKVSLVENIFHESTIAALQSCSIYTDTASFLEIIRSWWNIINVKTKFKGQAKRNDLATPIFSDNDFKVVFLKKFVMWLDSWHQIPEGSSLTNDTYLALKNSTSILIKVIEYSFNHLNIEFILPGKFQTDNLEERFGRYRYLSGCNYNISVTQVIDSEKKIRIQNILKSSVTSDLTQLKFQPPDDLNCATLNQFIECSEFTSIFNSDYLRTYNCEESSQIYISGYAVHTVQKTLKCLTCRDLIVQSIGDKVNDEYFDYLQRGGLSVATNEVHYIYYHSCALFEYIIKHPETMSLFLSHKNQKYLLASLALTSLESDNFYIDFSKICVCGTAVRELYFKISVIFSNTLLNNFTKNKNNEIMTKKLTKSLSKKRKLSTLKK